MTKKQLRIDGFFVEREAPGSIFFFFCCCKLILRCITEKLFLAENIGHVPFCGRTADEIHLGILWPGSKCAPIFHPSSPSQPSSDLCRQICPHCRTLGPFLMTAGHDSVNRIRYESELTNPVRVRHRSLAGFCLHHTRASCDELLSHVFP